MPIFKISTGKLKKLNTIPLDKEKNLQQLVEENLFEVLELHFLATEFSTTFGGRIDTLAVDINGAPVIIEYKRNKNENVINQSLSYLKWLKTQKPGFFEKLMADKLGNAIAAQIKLDWSNPRVICVAEAYSKFDIDTVEVVPLRIELFKYRFYEDQIFGLEPVTVNDQALDGASIPLPKDPGNAEQSVSVLREKAAEPIKKLFDSLQEGILAIDEGVVEKPTSFYVAYRASKNFAEVHIGKNQIKIHLRPVEYDDPKGAVDKIPEGYNWSLDRRIYLNTPADLDYVLGIVEQSYKSVI